MRCFFADDSTQKSPTRSGIGPLVAIGGGAVLEVDACRCEGGWVLPADRHDLLDQHVWVTWVAGMWHRGEGTQDPSFAPGEPLALIPEPDNAFDEHAVGIWNETRSLMVGYIGHRTATDMTPAQRFGFSLMEHVEEGKRTGLLIAVSREPIQLSEVALEPARVSWHIRRLPRMPKQSPPTVDPIEAMRKMLE